jgi:hypothetical protein
VGKSRLMRELAQYAASLRLTTLTGRCYEMERATPYQPVIERVTRSLALATDEALRAERDLARAIEHSARAVGLEVRLCS